MSNKSKIVDLVMGKDGTYSEKNTEPSKPHKPIKKYPSNIIGSSKKAESFKNNKDTLPPNVNEFFSGLDSGLDLVEGISSRVERFMGLRD